MRKDYKQKNSETGMLKERKAQISIFVIIALVIVAVIIIIFLYPRIKDTITTSQEPFSPQSYLQKCIEPEIKPVLETLSKQGGYMNPEGYATFNDTKVKYLCYIEGYYQKCLVQQPNIKGQFESELNKQINSKLIGCVNNLKQEYERQGFDVSAGTAKATIELIPGKISINVEAPMTITKETSRTFKSFDASINSEMYDLLMIANSIIDFESTYGDSETTLYLRYYPNLRIDKIKHSDGTKIYILTNVVTNEKFTFASRSISWPPGYGLV